MPHAKYILSNAALSALDFCEAEPHGEFLHYYTGCDSSFTYLPLYSLLTAFLLLLCISREHLIEFDDAIPTLDRAKVEDAHSRQEFENLVNDEILDVEVTEADIANAAPRIEFEEEDPDATNTEVVDADIVVIDGPHLKGVATFGTEEHKG